jgi:ParB-like chromosome segregation protein Spo0J
MSSPSAAPHSTRKLAQGKLWANRIVRHADVDPSTLAPSELNWRRHPQSQADALAGVLGSIGVVQSVIVNERSGRIVDGHLRVQLAVERSEPLIPVVYVDLDDAEERLILATLDPLAALAETDAEQLRALLADVSTDDAALADLLSSLAASVTPTLPTPREQTEPTLASECLIEIRCTIADRDDFADTLTEWGMRDGVSIDIS